MTGLLRGLIEPVRAVGLPIERMTPGQRTLHPEAAAIGYSCTGATLSFTS